MKLKTLIQDYSLYPDDSTTWWKNTKARLADVVVILDDDPLGGQAVCGIPVYLSWNIDTLIKAFKKDDQAFFILTSTRSMGEEDAFSTCYEIAFNVATVAQRMGKTIQIICRSDSTLRIHYPVETEAIIKGMNDADLHVDGEIIFPFFEEGKRYTYNNEQYGLIEDGELLPVSQMEYAFDKTFGFMTSYLPEWIEEKSSGRISASSVKTVDLSQLRSGWRNMVNTIFSENGFCVSVVDSIEYRDLFTIIHAVTELRNKGRSYILRVAASGVRAAIFNTNDKKMLQTVLEEKSPGKILVAAGSHMKRTTAQLSYLIDNSKTIKPVVFDQRTVFNTDSLRQEVDRAVSEIHAAVAKGYNVLLETRRERVDIAGASAEAQLALSVKISKSFMEIIDKVKKEFSCIIAKGGNTSSDIVRECFHAEYATVMGQLIPGVPVWRLPDGPLIVIFPGNVGETESLADAYKKLVD